MEAIRSFKEHHKNQFNLTFHVICGMAYMGMVIHLVGPMFILPYCLYLCYLFPRYVPIHAAIGIMLYAIHNFMSLFSWPVKLKVMFIVFFYMAPELSHWLTSENTVLRVNDLSITSISENFFLLPPLSILSYINAA